MLRNLQVNFLKNDNNIVKTPMDISMYISKNKGEEIHQSRYSAILWSLMYVMNRTRSDIASLVGKLNRFTNNLNINN